MPRALRSILAGLALVLLTAGSAAGDDFETGLDEPAVTLQRATPRQAVVGFLEAARAGEYATAAHYLDLGDIPDSERARTGPRLARRLKIVLDTTFWVDPDALSDRENGQLDDGLGPDADLLTTLRVGNRELPIRVHRVSLDGGGHAWVFDRNTVAATGPLYGEFGFGWLGDHLPASFFSIRLFEVTLWQFIAGALLLGIGWLAARVLTAPLMGILNRSVRRTRVRWDDDLAAAVRGPLIAGLFASAVYFGSHWLGLATPVQAGLAIVWRLLTIMILGWLLSSWVSVGAKLLVKAVADDEGSLAKSFVPLFARVARIGVWVLVGVLALDAAGIRVMGLIAGLGIGGLAIAFAAQKTIENFFGALAIASDRPFQKGDFVDVGGVKGTVEAVGLRSTRLRTLARSVVTIPNASVSTATVENIGARERILFNPTIGLIYGTTRAQIELVIDEIKKLLERHPKVWRESYRVRMAAFGASSVDIGILSWIDTTDYNEYTAVVEELNLEIMRVVEEAGTSFAFPSQTLYLGRDGGIDDRLAEAAAEEVKARREAGELWIPEPP